MKINTTSIPDLLYITDIPIFSDERGSFRTPFRIDMGTYPQLAWLETKQWNISENERGATRGIHAEPWNKFVHVITGKAFAAIVDLTFGEAPRRIEIFELDATCALYIPKGCGNSFQALDFTIYAYLTSELWQAGEKYLAVSLDDPELAIDWPIKDPERIISDKDRALPTCVEVFGEKMVVGYD
ncbi:MAG: dTDP-4-dehydrorhamnose 3,5-epimerase family protein [Patescibacteria group bacterium]